MVTIRLQMKTHRLPRGGRVAQYTTTIPRDMVREMGWEKGDKIEVELRSGKSVLLQKENSS